MHAAFSIAILQKVMRWRVRTKPCASAKANTAALMRKRITRAFSALPRKKGSACDRTANSESIMTDEATSETPKRGPGRPPKHVRRQSMRKPVHSGNDGDPDRNEKYEFIPYEARDKFYIPHDVVESFRRDFGRVLMWVATEC